MSTILGAHSPTLDAVRALRSKAGRAEQGRFAIEGPTLLADALAAGHRPESLYVTERGEQSLDPAGRAALGDRTFVVPDKAMARLSDLETPPGILAVMPAGLARPTELFDGSPVVILAGIADPGNAGTLLRTAEIFGITRAVLTSDGVEAHNPKVVRATMGAFFRMRIAVASGVETTGAAKEAAYDIVAADGEGLPLPTFVFPERCAIAIGNERRGVGGSLDSWQQTVAIPQSGGGESLNAAIAGAIIFYVFSQRFQRTISPG